MLYRRLSVLFVVLLAVVLVVFAQPKSNKVTTLADAMSAPEVENIAYSFEQFTDVHISH